jgi:hypothetical protein
VLSLQFARAGACGLSADDPPDIVLNCRASAPEIEANTNGEIGDAKM